jgi:membrane protease YdiL (CAAX protease family)
VLIVLQMSLALVQVNFPAHASDVWVLGIVQAVVLGGASFALSQVEHIPLGPLLPEADARSWTWSAVAVALGVGLNVVASLLREVIERITPTSDAEKAFQETLLRHDSASKVIILFLVIGVVGPLWEELFYRGVLFEFLERHVGSTVAVWFSSLTFTLTHAAYRDWLPLLLVALGLGYLRQRASALLPSALLHITFNCMTLLALVFGEGKS